MVAKGTAEKYIKYPEGWLNARRFEDYSSNEPVGPEGEAWGWWRGQEAVLRRMSEGSWEAAVEALKPNGTWPWWKLTAPPGHPECLVHPNVVTRRKLLEEYQGKIIAYAGH